MGMAKRETRPIELELERDRQLRVRWADDHESCYPLSLLRRSCPCAACRGARGEQRRNPLHVLRTGPDPRDMVLAADAQLVGSYAVQIIWRDGHDAGIYDYGLLRSLCPCRACRGDTT